MNFINHSELSIDQELAFFLNVMDNSKINEQSHDFSKKISNPILFAVCPICGRKGHNELNCPHQIPSLSQLQEKINFDLESLSKKALKTNEYSTDEFGIVLVSQNQLVNPGQKSTLKCYCSNCGISHLPDKCSKPNIKEIIQIMGKELNSHESIPSKNERCFFEVWKE